ncbi:MAG: lactate utilization protein [Desulfovibrionaceae bacterium]
MSVATKRMETFTQKAKAVSAVVNTVKTPDEAFAYVVDLCDKKEACQLLVSGCEMDLSTKGEALCDKKQTKVIAAPALPKKQFEALKALCDAQGFDCIDSGLRNHLAGIDIGLTYADWGIAETGSLVIDSSSENLRLTTMVSEIHVAILPVSKIKDTSYDQEKALSGLFGKTPNYTAFVTGASRTADIERVLALGVHGPLELHILLLEDK